MSTHDKSRRTEQPGGVVVVSGVGVVGGLRCRQNDLGRFFSMAAALSVSSRVCVR
ncbi:hypothetical protein K2X33_05105 [bacterium]|nr:hypothetical protein [bacterium]